MRIERWMGLMAAALLVMGCGGDDNGEGEEPNNQAANEMPNQGEPNNQSPNGEASVEEDDIDVWVGSTLDNEGDRTAVSPGQTLGGRFGRSGSHFFEVDADGGTLLTLEIEALDGAMAERLDEMSWRLRPRSPQGDHDLVDVTADRRFQPHKSAARQFFIPADGAYELRVDAPGDEEEPHGFALSLTAQALDSDGDGQALEIGQAVDQQTLEAEALDQWRLSLDAPRSLEMTWSSTDGDEEARGWLYLWDVDRGELVSQSNRRSEDGETRMVVGLEEGDYQWIVDMVDHPQGASYELSSRELATSESNPKRMSLGGQSNFEGVIEAPGAEPYSDYFEVILEPGDAKRLSVEGLDQLNPAMVLRALEGGGDAGGIPEVALGEGSDAAAYLALGEEAGESARMLIEVSDVVHLQGSLTGDPVGGEGYDYALSLEAAEPEGVAIDGGSASVESLESGESLEISATVMGDELLALVSDVQPASMEVSSVDTTFVPTWVDRRGLSLSPMDQLMGHWRGQHLVARGDGQEMGWWFRDRYHRGGPQGDVQLEALIVEDGLGGATEDVSGGAASTASAPALSAPVRVNGTFGSDDEEDARYFSLGDGGQPLVIIDRGSNADLDMELVDHDGEVLQWATDVQGAAGEQALVVASWMDDEVWLRLVRRDCGATGCDDEALEVDVRAGGG